LPWRSSRSSVVRVPVSRNRPKVAVKGTASFGGKPIADGEIFFTVGAETPQPIEIKDGHFSGEAMVGKNKVEIKAYKNGPPLSTDPKGPPQKINTTPDKYQGPNSTLTADIPEGLTIRQYRSDRRRLSLPRRGWRGRARLRLALR